MGVDNALETLLARFSTAGIGIVPLDQLLVSPLYVFQSGARVKTQRWKGSPFPGLARRLFAGGALATEEVGRSKTRRQNAEIIPCGVVIPDMVRAKP